MPFSGGVGTLGAKNLSDAIALTDTTAASSQTTGALKTSGGLGVAGDVHANGITPHVAPNAAWGIDFSGAGQISIPGNSSYALAVGSGLVMMTDSAVTGQTGLYLIGGSTTSAAALLAGGAAYVAPTVTPASNKYSVGFDGTVWRIYNGNASAITFFVGLIRIRNTV